MTTLADAAVVASRHLLRTNQPVLDYLHERGLTDKTIEAWNLGLWSQEPIEQALTISGFTDEEIARVSISGALEGRLTVPLTDPSGHPHAFVGRNLPGATHPVRWLYPPNDKFFSRRDQILGLDRVLDWLADGDPSTLRYPPIMMEGPFDVILSQQARLPTVSAHGTTFTREQALMMRGLDPNSMIVCPDGGDEEALAAFRKSVKSHRDSLPGKVYLCTLPPGADPAYLLQLGRLDVLESRLQDALQTPHLIRS